MARNVTRQPIQSKKHLARLERERLQRRYIIIGSIIVAVLVVALIGYGILDQYYLQGIRPVAVVNGQNISTRDFQIQDRYARQRLIDNANNTLQFMQYFGSDPNTAASFQNQLLQIQSQLVPATIGKQVLDQMINDVLIRQEAKKRGITVTSQELDKAVQEAFGYYANGTPTPTPTEKLVPTSTLNPTQLALVPPTSTPTATPAITATGILSATESLTPGAAQSGTPAAAQSAAQTATQAPNTTTTPTAVPSATPTEAPTPSPTPYTLQGFQDTYKKKVSDLNKSLGFTDKDLRYLVETQLYQEKLMKALMAEEKVTPTQDEVWARHILVADEKTAQQVLDRLNKGEAWDKVAAEMSTDTSNKDNGGDLGWFYKGQMDPAFEKAAYELKIGQISQPVKTSFGYHIIQVLGHETRTLSESDFQQLEQTRFQTWLQGVHDKAKIDIKSDWVDKAPAEPTLPANITNYLQQQQNAQPQAPDLNLPTEAPGAAVTPEPSTNQGQPAASATP